MIHMFSLMLLLNAHVLVAANPLQPAISKYFGKTHFIVGMPPQQQNLFFHPIKPIEKIRKSTHSSSCFAYFAPDDNLQELLCELISKETKAIDIAIFSFTNKHIAEALIRAHKRGVHIRIITDKSGAQDRFSKIPLLQKNNIPIYIYDMHYKKKPQTLSDIMHNKFALFEKNSGNKACVWTGSFNFTHSGTRSNQENVLVVTKKLIVQKFKDQFKRLLTRCKKAV